MHERQQHLLKTMNIDPPSVIRAALGGNLSREELEEHVEKAARAGDTYVLQLLFDQNQGQQRGGSGTQTQTKQSPSAYCTHKAFHSAAEHGHAPAVQFLLTQQQVIAINVNVQNGQHETALHLAAARGHINVLKVLLDKSFPDPYIREALQNKTPIEIAQAQSHTGCVELLRGYESTWRRHVLNMLVRLIMTGQSRLGQIPFALINQYVLEALAGGDGEMVVRREQEMEEQIQQEEEDAEMSEESEDEEGFPRSFSQGQGQGQAKKKRKRRRMVAFSNGEEEEDGIFNMKLPSSQEDSQGSNDSHSNTCKNSKTLPSALFSHHHCGSPHKNWDALRSVPLPSRSFLGVME